MFTMRYWQLNEVLAARDMYLRENGLNVGGLSVGSRQMWWILDRGIPSG